MKKSLKAIGITLGALVLAAAIAGLVYMWPMFSMAPTPTGPEGGTGALAVQTSRNSVYLLEIDGGGYLAVDAATNPARVADELAALGIDPLEVRYVLLTHADADHVGALGLFANAQIYMGAMEEQMVNGATRRGLLVGYSSLPDGTDTRLTLVENGESLNLGGHAIACVATPGHTPGSMSFVVDGTLLFTGDAAGVANGALAVHPYTMDKPTAQASIEALKGLEGIEYVLTAHYGCHTAEEVLQAQ